MEAHPRLVKVVRDNVGGLLDDSRVIYKPVENRSMLVAALRQKLIEEAVEYVVNPSIGELADVLEVIRALADFDLGIRFDRVQDEALDKRLDRGGFHDGVGMFVTSTASPRHEGEHAEGRT